MQDFDNPGWKLGLVLRGQAPDALLDSYHEECAHGADENILNFIRSTDFATPKTAISHVFRNAVLDPPERHAFARPLVNSGRLSVPCSYHGLSRIGKDAPLGAGFLLPRPGGDFS